MKEKTPRLNAQDMRTVSSDDPKSLVFIDFSVFDKALRALSCLIDNTGAILHDWPLTGPK
jgi:hypothetical protein